MSKKKYPWPKATGVQIPKTDWICKAILNGDIQIDYDDEYAPPTVTRGEVGDVFGIAVRLKNSVGNGWEVGITHLVEFIKKIGVEVED